jgi:hypothetical protein
LQPQTPHLPPDWKGKYRDVNPMDKLHEDEPFFFLRAQDITAPGAVEAYGQHLKNMAQTMRLQVEIAQEGDADEDRYALIMEQVELLERQSLDCYTCAEAMRIWQHRNPDLIKVPD